MLILAIDCAIKSVSLALVREGKVRASVVQEMERGQGEALIPMIADLMKKERLSLSQIEAVAVSVGPGSFTGVRIGLAAARGIGLALKIPVYGMTTLSALAYGMTGKILAVIDTKRGDFYTQQFSRGKAIEEPQIRTIEDLKKMENCPVVGIKEPVEGWSYEALQNKWTVAEAIGLGAEKNPLPPEPIYLREADVSFPKSH